MYLTWRSPGPARAVRTSHGRCAAMLRAAWWHVVRWLSWPLPWLRRGCHNSRIFVVAAWSPLVVERTAGRRLVATFGSRLGLKVPRVGRAAAVLPARRAVAPGGLLRRWEWWWRMTFARLFRSQFSTCGTRHGGYPPHIDRGLGRQLTSRAVRVVCVPVSAWHSKYNCHSPPPHGRHEKCHVLRIRWATLG